jgi:hypothetical protein
MKRFLLLIALVGCGDSVEFAAMRVAFENAKETVVSEQKATSEKTTEAVVILKENTAALARIETKLEASLAKSEPQNGKDGDPASAPNPPAKANTALAPLKVATPGNFSEPETLVELATRLYAQGVNTHMKTEQQLRAIDAQMLGTNSTPVRYQSRPTYSQPSGTVCIDGQCFTPQRVRRSRR